MSDSQNSDPFDVAAGARKLAIDTAIRALIDHAQASDPTLRDRIVATVDAYVAALDPQSEAERVFADMAKAYTAALVRPLA